MSEDTQLAGIPAATFSAAALDEWTWHVESMLRGIAHALNNRASAVSALRDLAGEPDDDADVARSILSTELERLTDLAAVVRTIGAPRAGGSEAVSPADIAAEATGALRLHADQRERVIMIDAHGAPPARVPRWMLVRALITLAATGASADDRARTVRIAVTGEGEWLVARLVDAPPSARCSTYAGELAVAMGGGPLDRGCGFRVPTLESIRRREGR